MLGSVILNSLISSDQFDVFTFGRKSTQKVKSQNQYFTNESNAKLNQIPLVADFIIHCAANTDLNECENNIREAMKDNVQLVDSLNQFASVNTKLYYISTDSVFDGNTGNYLETDKTNPLNNYAKTKLKGEERARKKFKGKTTIIRTNIFGFNIPLRKSIVEWALNEWSNHKTISGYQNLYFNAIYTAQLAEVLVKLINDNCTYDCLNIASKNYVSKYDFLDKLRKEFGFPIELLVSTNFTAQNQNLIRPMNTTLNIELLSEIYDVPTVEFGLKQLKVDWNKQYDN